MLHTMRRRIPGLALLAFRRPKTVFANKGAARVHRIGSSESIDLLRDPCEGLALDHAYT